MIGSPADIEHSRTDSFMMNNGHTSTRLADTMAMDDLVVRRRNVQLDGVRCVYWYPSLSDAQDIKTIVRDYVMQQSGFIGGGPSIQ